MSNSKSLATTGACVARITPGEGVFIGDWFRSNVSALDGSGNQYMDIYIQGPGTGPLRMTLADKFSDGTKYQIRKNSYPLVKFNHKEATSGEITLMSYDKDAEKIHLRFDFDIDSENEQLNIKGDLDVEGFAPFEVTEDMRVRSLEYK
jgi:hypothetical protein